MKENIDARNLKGHTQKMEKNFTFMDWKNQCC